MVFAYVMYVTVLYINCLLISDNIPDPSPQLVINVFPAKYLTL